MLGASIACQIIKVIAISTTEKVAFYSEGQKHWTKRQELNKWQDHETKRTKKKPVAK